MDYSKHIKFGRIYVEDWPYEPNLGVGLEFCGTPTDKIKFIDILQDASCNPIASRRILEVLDAGKVKQVTVMSGLRFDDIYDSLEAIGVDMKIIPPFNYAKSTDIEDNAKMDYAALNAIKGVEGSAYENNLTDIQKEEVKLRIIAARKSLDKLPHHFGAYE